MTESTPATHHFGHVALLGRPNVGKSTLLNRFIGERLSIISPKPQTTRHRLLGILTRDDAQIGFIDTPGHQVEARAAIHRRMNRIVYDAPLQADVLLHVVQVPRFIAEDDAVWQLIRKHELPRLLVINKVDRIADKTRLLLLAEEVMASREYAGVHFICARRGDGVPRLLDDIVARLPEGPTGYPTDEFTDRNLRFLAAELVREQLMRGLSEELPYATTVEIESFEQDGKLARIGAVIWVERDSQKAIVIGRGGAKLKEMGRGARLAMEKLFGGKVFLELWVNVKEGWLDDEAVLRRFGYHD